MATTLWLALALGLGQIVKGTTGFGSALVSLPLLMLVLPPVEAIILSVCTDFFAGWWLAYKARHEIPWKILFALLPASVFGLGVGVTCLLTWSPDLIRITLALLVAFYAGRLLLYPERQFTCKSATSIQATIEALLLGSASGFFAGLVGAGGPPVVLFTRRWFNEKQSRALLLAFFAPSETVLILILWWQNQFVNITWLHIGISIVLGLSGAQVGTWLAPYFQRQQTKKIQPRHIIGILLGFSAAMLLTN